MIHFFKRLDKYLFFKGLNDNKVTIDCNISNGLIGKARKRGSLSQENISKVLFTYTDLNPDWLLTGRGEMLRSEGASVQLLGGGNPDLHSELARLKEEIVFHKKTIAHQAAFIDNLQLEIAALRSVKKTKKQ